MLDLLNTVLALASIGFGLIGWFAPRYTMQLLDLRPEGSTMGVSEIRAASGALFVGVGLGAILIDDPLAYAMLGFAWGGAAVGRITSIVADEQPTRRTWGFFATEAVIAGALLAINL